MQGGLAGELECCMFGILFVLVDVYLFLFRGLSSQMLPPSALMLCQET